MKINLFIWVGLIDKLGSCIRFLSNTTTNQSKRLVLYSHVLTDFIRFRKKIYYVIIDSKIYENLFFSRICSIHGVGIRIEIGIRIL